MTVGGCSGCWNCWPGASRNWQVSTRVCSQRPSEVGGGNEGLVSFCYCCCWASAWGSSWACLCPCLRLCRCPCICLSVSVSMSMSMTMRATSAGCRLPAATPQRGTPTAAATPRLVRLARCLNCSVGCFSLGSTRLGQARHRWRRVGHWLAGVLQFSTNQTPTAGAFHHPPARRRPTNCPWQLKFKSDMNFIRIRWMTALCAGQ